MKKLLGTLLSLVLLFSVVTVAFAEDSESTASSSRGSVIRQLLNIRVGQKRACDVRAESVAKRSVQLTQRAQKMKDNFTKIAARVKTYYTDKVLPAGGTVSNYDALVAEISTKEAAVDAALAEAKAKSDAFTCDDLTKVKSQADDYRVAMQKVISALKEYRTSVRNLIVAVRTAAGKVKPSPSPTATP